MERNRLDRILKRCVIIVVVIWFVAAISLTIWLAIILVKGPSPPEKPKPGAIHSLRV